MSLPNPGREREILRALFDAALMAAEPKGALAPHMPAPAPGRNLVVGAGKAAAAMARAFEALWTGPDLEGLVVTRYGHAEGIGPGRIGDRRGEPPRFPTRPERRRRGACWPWPRGWARRTR